MKRKFTLEDVRLPSGLLALLKKEAQRRRCTVSGLIERAVRSELAAAERSSAPKPAGPGRRAGSGNRS